MDIGEIIKTDLSCYTQDTGHPKSITIRDNITWRHYELGEIKGFVVWEDEDRWIGITSITEDDGFFSEDSHELYMSAFWTPYVFETFFRMTKWIKENLKDDKLINEIAVGKVEDYSNTTSIMMQMFNHIMDIGEKYNFGFEPK